VPVAPGLAVGLPLGLAPDPAPPVAFATGEPRPASAFSSGGARMRSSIASATASPTPPKTSSPSRGAQPRSSIRRQVRLSAPTVSPVVSATAA
jgi:hypothetical protein